MRQFDQFLPATAQRADAATLACAYVAAITIVPAHFVAKGIAVTPAHVLGLGTGILVLCAHLTTTLGMAKGRNVVRTALVAYVVSIFFNYGYAARGTLDADELKNMDHKFIIMGSVLSTTILVCDGVRSRARLNTVLKAVAVGGAFVALVAFVQARFHLDYTRLFIHVPGLNFVPDYGGAVIKRGDISRPAGTTGTPIELGVLCAMTLPLAIHYALRARERGERQWFWWACAGMIFLVIFLSVSRSAILGMAASGLLLFVGWPARRRVVAIGAALVGVVVIKLTTPGVIGTIVGLFTHLSSDTSVQWRQHDYPIAAAQIAQQPWLGRGNWTWFATKHEVFDNQYLLTLVEAGVVGLVVFVALLFSGLYAGLRTRVTAQDPELRELGLTVTSCLLVPVIGSVLFDLLSFAIVTGITFILLGAAGCLLRLSAEPVAVNRSGTVVPPPTRPTGSTGEPVTARS